MNEKTENKKIELKGIKIGRYFIEKPIVQGGMGVGISWDQLEMLQKMAVLEQ